MANSTCEDCQRKDCDKRNKIRQPVVVDGEKYCNNFIKKYSFFTGERLVKK